MNDLYFIKLRRQRISYKHAIRQDGSFFADCKHFRSLESYLYFKNSFGKLKKEIDMILSGNASDIMVG